MPTILVVDDHKGDRQLAGVYLESIADLTLLFAEDGVQACEMLAQRTPDIVITDLRMPRMDGLELVGKIRAQYPYVPVILMTSYGSEEIAIQALRRGAASYVSKATREANLVPTVEHVLSVAHANKQRKQLYRHLKVMETHFILENDPVLIPTLIGHLQENLDRLGVCDENERTRVGMALQEALDNALYHGNLELSSDLREQDLGDFYNLANERRGLGPYRDRRIYVIARESHEGATYVIRDEGKGFDPRSVPDPTSPEMMDRVSGRGLLLIRTFMDQVDHNDTGNEVTMVKLNPALRPMAAGATA